MGGVDVGGATVGVTVGVGGTAVELGVVVTVVGAAEAGPLGDKAVVASGGAVTVTAGGPTVATTRPVGGGDPPHPTTSRKMRQALQRCKLTILAFIGGKVST